MVILKSKNFWFGLVLFVAVFFVFLYKLLDSAVYINDGDKTIVTITSESNPLKILDGAGVKYGAQDLIDYTLESNAVSTISITRSYPVYVSVDGQTKLVYSLGETVGEILKDMGVKLREFDEINMQNDYVPLSKEAIVITRVDYREYESKEPIPKTVTTKQSSLIRLGTTKIIEQGQDGAKLFKYRDRIENGVVVDTECISEETLKQPTEEFRLKGSKDQVSNLDYSDEFPLDENGIPKNYMQIFQNQRATGYWRGGTPWGANGMLCEAGTVAVRSSQIPFGSKLYIRTSSGDFIYGYALANDTGSALVDNVIDVDLFYDTYEESKWNSVRWVDIYVLEWGNNKYYKPKTDVDVLN